MQGGFTMIRHVFDAWPRFWAMSWWWKGPTLAIIPLIFLGTGLAFAMSGNGDTAVVEVPKPSPTAAISPTAATTSEALQSATAETTPPPEPIQEAPAQQPPAQQPPAQQPPAQEPPAQPTQPPAALPTNPPPPPPPNPTPTPAPVDSELLYELGYNAGYPDGYYDGSTGAAYLASFYIDPTIGVGSVYYPSGYADGYSDGYSDGEDYFETIPQGCLPNC